MLGIGRKNRPGGDACAVFYTDIAKAEVPARKRQNEPARNRKVDDTPYGGGGGMVLRPEPLFHAVEFVRQAHPAGPDRVVLLSPQGPRLDHGAARRLADYSRVILLCGRYEGFDERVFEILEPEEVSLGDFVLALRDINN